ncbi:MAG: acyltransferase [Prevotella sp.]|nr:acyltransferase [Candidatus Prevotella equi]
MNNKERLQWLDAMRGFTMILVVMYHVAHVSFGMTDKLSSCQPFLVLFRMPLFFFVSGFLAYKAGMQWTGKTLGMLTLKKMKVQIIPAAIFLCVFTALCRKNFLDTLWASLQGPTKGGYWFTWVLLHMFLIYYVCCYVARRLGVTGQDWKGRALLALSLLTAITLYALSYMPPVMKQLDPTFKSFLDWSSLIQTVHYMQYFLLGNIVHRYWQQTQRLMDTQWFFVLVLALAFVGTGDSLVWHNLKFMWRNLPLTVASYTLLMIVVMFFRHYKDAFTREHRIGSALQYIGTRTLDIYLLHFLFLPTLPMVGQWFNHHRHNFVLDFTSSFLMALVVIAFCLLTSNIIRVNPILSEWLFGKKDPPRPSL